MENEMEKQASTWANETERKRDQRRRKILSVKSAISLWWNGVFWNSLHFVGLARPYSVAMCRLGRYRQFRDGRCMWCGIVHGE